MLRKSLVGVAILGLVVSCSSASVHPPPAANNNSTVVPSDGGTSSGGVIPGSGTRRCFQDDESDLPKCSWVEVKAGESVTIKAIPQTSTGGAAGPAEDFVLTLDAPEAFASKEECVTRPVGFVLKKAGISETDQPDQGVYWFTISPDGKWNGAGNGGVTGLVAAIDPTKVRDDAGDGGATPAITYAIANHCDALYENDETAIVTTMSVIHRIRVGTTYYEAEFSTMAEDLKDTSLPRRYYFVIRR